MTGEAKTLIGIGLVTLVMFIGGIVALTKDRNPVSQTADQEILVRENSNVLAGENSKVTIVEFADYQCPFCAQTHPALQVMLTQYGDQITYVYRHYPLLQHQYAQLAAEAAEAAGAQGKYWEMHDLLYLRQAEWAESGDALTIFQQYAEELELNMEEFNLAIESNRFLPKIQQDLADGNTAGVSGTPTFFVDGNRFSGSVNGLMALVEARINQGAEENAELPEAPEATESEE